MPAPLPLCVIGAGLVGMRHIEVALSSPRIELTAIVEPDTLRAAPLTSDGLRVVPTIDDVPTNTRAAIVATPTPNHHDSVIAAFDRGMGVVVEKPTASTLKDARNLAARAAGASLPFFTGHHRRVHPFSIAARSEIAGIGDLVAVQGLWSLRKNDAYYDAAWRRGPGAGPLMTNLTHEIDLLRFMIGEMVEVSAFLSSANRGFVVEDTAALSFRFANGALGSFLISDAGASPWSFESGSYENPSIAGSGEDYVRIVGTEGALQFPSLVKWGRCDDGEIEWSKPLRRYVAPPFPKIDPLLVQIERFAAVMDGGEDDVLCTGRDGIAAMEMTLAAALSGKTGTPIKAENVPGDFTGA